MPADYETMSTAIEQLNILKTRLSAHGSDDLVLRDPYSISPQIYFPASFPIRDSLLLPGFVASRLFGDDSISTGYYCTPTSTIWHLPEMLFETLMTACSGVDSSSLSLLFREIKTAVECLRDAAPDAIPLVSDCVRALCRAIRIRQLPSLLPDLRAKWPAPWISTLNSFVCLPEFIGDAALSDWHSCVCLEDVLHWHQLFCRIAESETTPIAADSGSLSAISCSDIFRVYGVCDQESEVPSRDNDARWDSIRKMVDAPFIKGVERCVAEWARGLPSVADEVVRRVNYLTGESQLVRVVRRWGYVVDNLQRDRRERDWWFEFPGETVTPAL